jgi:predicted aldo/keto reductase-like oxidoreductase
MSGRFTKSSTTTILILIFAPNGAIEALVQAKQQGKVRFVGFTGHKDPQIHLKMLAHDFPFDTVQMPLNCLDATFRSFETQVLPELNRRGIAPLGMKSMTGSGEVVSHGACTPQQALRYAMSLPVATTISGMESIDVLHQNLEVARGFQPMTAAEMNALREQVQFWASEVATNCSRRRRSMTATRAAASTSIHRLTSCRHEMKIQQLVFANQRAPFLRRISAAFAAASLTKKPIFG